MSIQETYNPQREFVTIRKFHIVSQNVRIEHKFMFCVFRNEHILIARVFYIEHKSTAKVQQKFGNNRALAKNIQGF